MLLPNNMLAIALRRMLSLLCLLLVCAGASAAESVQALGYGVTLYHYFQQDYFSALTELMVAQEKDSLGVHSDNGELLRGGISLSYGMDLQAEQVFTQLLAQPRLEADRDRAWFYLGKIAWQRGELERAATALDRVEVLAAPELNEELNYLQTTLKAHQGDYPAAQEYLTRLPPDSPWLAYHYYNMGAMLASVGDWPAAIGYFRNFDRLQFNSQETKSLRDRAYTALGYASMAVGDYAEAGRDFTRVRLDSPMSDRALLGYGWAVSAQEDYQAALSPWMALSKQAPDNQPVRESLLAVPYAYEQLNRESVALSRYQQAAQVFEDELGVVNQAIVAFTQDDLQELLELRAEERDNWLSSSDILPLNPQAPYLKQLISSHAFQAAMKELRDLHRIDRHLVQVSVRLEVLAVADIEQHQQSWFTIIEQDRGNVFHNRRKALQKQLAGLQARFAKARVAGDGRALGQAPQLALWQRLQRAAALAKKLDKIAQHRDALNLYRGLLIWEDNEQFPQNLWANSRDMAELQVLLQQTNEGITRLEQARARRDNSSFAGDIADMRARLKTETSRVQLAIATSGAEVRRVAVTELEGQALALSRSLGQSKLAIARLYDIGSVGDAR
jgi:tetratricopeptide (TPR) repeat protein